MSSAEAPNEEIAQAIGTTIQQVEEPVKVQTGPIWPGIQWPSCSVCTTIWQATHPVPVHVLDSVVLDC